MVNKSGKLILIQQNIRKTSDKNLPVHKVRKKKGFKIDFLVLKPSERVPKLFFSLPNLEKEFPQSIILLLQHFFKSIFTFKRLTNLINDFDIGYRGNFASRNELDIIKT